MATLSFWGGVGTVTGSKYLIETAHARVLVDCGMFQGLKELRERNWQEPPFDPRQVNAVLITHAHIDHTGYLPRLASHGFSGPVYCSRGTADLLKILLPDAGRLQEEEADYRNRHNLTKHKPALPLYTEKDSFAALKLIRPVANTGELVDVATGVGAAFRISGHILGSSLVLVEIANAAVDGSSRRVLFSGDLGHYDQPIIRNPVPPPACDYLLVESTYGDRLHDPEDPKDALKRIINEAAARNGAVLLPAFAVGRTQEIIYLIRELEDEHAIPVLPVWVDSPMAAAATVAYANRTEEQDEDYASVLARPQHPLRTHSMITCSSREESKRLNTAQGARVIISASGMMTGGRVLHHALRLLPEPNTTLVFVGYQAAGTTGRRILNGEPEVKILGQRVPVRCRIERISSFSAHADWKEIIHWLEGMPSAPRLTFITHGEPIASSAMAGHIKERFGWTVEVPHYGERFELS
ncbi:MAG TPA: MBL fold metallo-hydrolase [Blastocatellia bacterium]|jgi:metallo-beta-lactamase family protein|nr:MBL fold metallo-hydrolase [Blastocatellia bacterium]HCX28450.1 MBL fold metallo-hydrolase [Blastocatellia bacterium]